MKVEIMYLNSKYEIQLEQITQLCGVNFERKQYIVQSLCKYFSNSKYALYEEQMQDNIRIEGEVVGRKYFSLFHISSRENLISAIKISKSSLLMQYLQGRYTEFACQTIMDKIEEDLEHLYLELNKDVESQMKHIKLGYDSKNLLEIIQSSNVYGIGEKPLENLSNEELLDIYLELLKNIQQRSPDKIMIIIENIDHLLDYNTYQKLLNKVVQFCEELDIWFIFSTSIEGFVVVNEWLIEGINVINDCLFAFPEMERILIFLQSRYPYRTNMQKEEIITQIRSVIQNIGREDYTINIRSNVILKLIQSTLCLRTKFEGGINTIENAFLADINVI